MTTQTQQSQLNKIAIYLLVDPRKPEIVRYVGQAEVPRIRHLQHCAENTKSTKGQWIESLRQEGLFPQMIIVEWTTEQMADGVERVWINRMNPEFLTNTAHHPKSLKPAKQQPSNVISVLEQTERDAIEEMLKKTGGNKKESAKLLGIGRQTLYNKIKAYQIVTTKG